VFPIGGMGGARRRQALDPAPSRDDLRGAAQQPQDPLDVQTSLSKWRNPAKALHGTFAGVVRGKRQSQGKTVEQRLEMLDAGVDVRRRIVASMFDAGS
jgi:hypothetical protein